MNYERMMEIASQINADGPEFLTVATPGESVTFTPFFIVNVPWGQEAEIAEALLRAANLASYLATE